MRLTSPALALLLGALGDALASGTLELYAGDAPATPGGVSSTATLLAELRFRGFTVNASGELEAAQLASGVARQSGTPKWFRARAADGAPVLDGVVGAEAGQLRIEPATLQQGGRVDGGSFVVGWGA